MDIKDIFIFLGGSAVGGFIELVTAIIFEDTARKFFNRTKRQYLSLYSKFKSVSQPSYHDFFSIGKWKVNCMVLEGSVDKPYLSGSISCKLDLTPLDLPEDLRQIRNRVAQEQKNHAEQHGYPLFYNGPMVSLQSFSFTRTPSAEDPLLFLKFKITDYYTFLATALSLNENVTEATGKHVTIREKYLSNMNYNDPIPFIATSFGINLAIITKDDFLFYVNRSRNKGLSNYSDHFSVPVLESVHPEFDKVEEGKLNLFKTAKRGIKEELGIDIQETSIKLFSLVVDTAWYMYGMTGVAHINYTKDDIISRRSIGVKDKWESSDFFFLPLNPKSVADNLRHTGGPSRWHPTSFACLIQTLIYETGQESAVSAFKTVAPH